MDSYICAICLEDVCNETENTQLEVCKHIFHKKCVDEWLCMKNTCPMCRECVYKKNNDMPTTWIEPRDYPTMGQYLDSLIMGLSELQIRVRNREETEEIHFNNIINSILNNLTEDIPVRTNTINSTTIYNVMVGNMNGNINENIQPSSPPIVHSRFRRFTTAIRNIFNTH